MVGPRSRRRPAQLQYPVRLCPPLPATATATPHTAQCTLPAPALPAARPPESAPRDQPPGAGVGSVRSGAFFQVNLSVPLPGCRRLCALRGKARFTAAGLGWLLRRRCGRLEVVRLPHARRRIGVPVCSGPRRGRSGAGGEARAQSLLVRAVAAAVAAAYAHHLALHSLLLSRGIHPHVHIPPEAPRGAAPLPKWIYSLETITMLPRTHSGC